MDPAANGYRLFPALCEDDRLYWFHGTAATNLDSILTQGFIAPAITGSTSFAKTSAAALQYACERRCAASPDAVIFLAKFAALPAKGVQEEGHVVQVYPRFALPEILHYVIVPASYQHR